TDQAVPFHRSVRVRLTNPPSGSGLTRTPTPHTSPDVRLATPNSWLFCVPWFGLGTTVHVEPSQCSVSVRAGAGAARVFPTAHTSFEPIAEMDMSSSPAPDGGAGTIAQAEPSQCSIRVPRWSNPTAHTSSAATAVTPSSHASVSLAG